MARLSVRNVIKIASAFVSDTSSSSNLDILFVVDCNMPRSALHMIKHEFMPCDSSVKVYVVDVRDTPTGTSCSASLFISDDVEAAITYYTNQQHPCAVVTTCPSAFAHRSIEGSVISADQNLCDNIARWFVRALTSDIETLCSAFPICRSAAVRQLSLECARDNAMIGAMTFLKKAAAPAMLINEATLAARISHLYAAGELKERLPEGTGLIAGTFLSKALARGARSLLPLPDFVVNGAVAFGATWLMGQGLEARHRFLNAHRSSSKDFYEYD